MLIKKITKLSTFLTLSLFSLNNPLWAASSVASNQNALTLEISAPDALIGLKKGSIPDPVYLQYTGNDGSAPIYSAAIIPGNTKPVDLQITSVNKNGAQIQFVSSITGTTQPMSFMFSFSEQRIACLIEKHAKIQVSYNINNKLLDVLGVPEGC